MADMQLEAITPFAAVLAKAGAHHATGAAGLTVRERVGFGLATVNVRRGGLAALTEAVRANWGSALRDEPVVSGNSDIAFIGIAPGGWLAISPEGGWRFAKDLAAKLDGHASVVDQSSGYGVLRLSGPDVRRVLAKGAPIDLHPAAFPPGKAAVTDIAHVGGILWRVDGALLEDEAASADAVFDVAVFRSLAGSFWHWLEDSAAEFGLERLPVSQ